MSGRRFRGVCYRAAEQRAGTIGLLVVSNDLANRTTREVTACPVLSERPVGQPSVRIEAGWVAVGSLVPRAEGSLEEEVALVGAEDMASVEAELADILLIAELTMPQPYTPSSAPAGAYPRWGSTYYAEPPLGGQNKRWMVVSHDHFNAATGDAICVRTTSNTSYAGHDVPLIEGGTAAAVCPDVMTKRHRRFNLQSVTELPQPTRDDRRKVAIGLANYLGLQAFVGRARPPG